MVAERHVHEWERGAHMAEAFGVDGRRYYCAICGIPYWCVQTPEAPGYCQTHQGTWPDYRRFCYRQGMGTPDQYDPTTERVVAVR